LQHGTILIDPDIEMMFSLLNVSAKKLEGKNIDRASKRVTSLREKIGAVNEKELIKSLVKGFEDGFGIRLADGEMDGEETGRIGKLREKYASKEWNFKR